MSFRNKESGPRLATSRNVEPSELLVNHGHASIDLKATALLKLIYLEMFGHDMSWAAFNVLEVMASPKYHQKRVGYLGAIQSFRPDTEVLMLATNLLKKVCRLVLLRTCKNYDENKILNMSLGFDGSIYDHHRSSYRYSSACYYTIPRSLRSTRSSTTTQPYPPCDP